MNAKAKRSAKTLPAKNRSSPCVCQGAGPFLTECLRHLGPPEAARQHFDAARIEFLKGLRAMIEAGLGKVSKPKARGEKIEVE